MRLLSRLLIVLAICLVAVALPAVPAQAQDAYILLSPDEGVPGEEITVYGYNFTHDEWVDIFYYHEAALNNIAGEDKLEDLNLPGYPIYIYFLTFIYWLFGGGNLTAVYIFQSLLVLAGGLFLFFALSRLFNRFCGYTGLALFLFYRMNLFYTIMVLPTALSQFLITLILLIYVLYRNNKISKEQYDDITYFGNLSDLKELTFDVEKKRNIVRKHISCYSIQRYYNERLYRLME